MSPRLTSKLLVGAIRRRVEAAGGQAMVLAKGDETSGSILLALARRGETVRLLERGFGAQGIYGWITTGPEDCADPMVVSDYLQKRRRSDPDIWIVELDHDDPGHWPEQWLDDMTGTE